MLACLVRVLVGLAGVYWPADGHTPAHGRMACGARYDADALTVAMRHVPCGTRVRVCRPGGACVYATVADRGPYWRCCPRHGCSAGQTCPLGVYRGIVDLTPAVARAIGLRGLGPVRVEIVGRQRPDRRSVARKPE